LELNSDFVIKFQHYDNYKITTDGFAFDQIYLIGPSPDLRSRRCVVMPRSIESGDPIYVSGTIFNSSNYDADSSILKYYLSEDQDFDYGSDIQLESRIVPALDAYESYYFSDTIEITPAKSGSKSYETWYVLFYVDGTNNIIESNEQNNEEYVSISIDWGDKSEGEENNESKAKSKLINNETYDINSLTVFPNPANNSFTIEFPNKNDDEYRISIKDINGKSIYSAKINSYNVQISTESWSPGTYFIELVGEKVYHNKIIKH